MGDPEVAAERESEQPTTVRQWWRSARPLHGLLAATALSFTGNAIVAVAVPWLIFKRTGSATAAGVAGAAAIAPIVLSALFGGALIDRLGRRFCAVGADLLSAIAVALLAILDEAFSLPFWGILALVALGAVFDGPGAAARETLRPDVARATSTPITRVNAWGEAAEAIGALAGPGIAGVLLVVLGGFNVLWVTVGMFLLSATITTLTIPSHLSPAPIHEPYFRSVVTGLRFLIGEPGLRTVAITAAILVGFIAPFESVVLNAHLQDTGHATFYGFVVAAFAGGGLIGAILYGVVGHRLPERAVLVTTLAVSALGLAVYALLPPLTVLLIVSVLTGIAAGPINPVVAVIMQARTPEHLRGRVIGSYTSVALAAGPLGLLLMGPIVDHTSPRIGFIVIAVGCALATLLAASAKSLKK
ncbi:MFS transporter [Kribbella antibiotica]|uniref:Multidrug efflux pump Tap n=1 Tax=Kribbella antibiotica TaxID=190195 RepID=A0A4R4ZL02_9ACTN|nr:MFS transporter [Kribbella antibiotica]